MFSYAAMYRIYRFFYLCLDDLHLKNNVIKQNLDVVVLLNFDVFEEVSLLSFINNLSSNVNIFSINLIVWFCDFLLNLKFINKELS